MEEKLGYALYLGPSILDHSCRPSAEVGKSGKNRGGRRREGLQVFGLIKLSL